MFSTYIVNFIYWFLSLFFHSSPPLHQESKNNQSHNGENENAMAKQQPTDSPEVRPLFKKTERREGENFSIRHFSEGPKIGTENSKQHTSDSGFLSWLDLYPPSEADLKTLQRKDELFMRIDKIREQLDEIKISVENRDHVVGVARTTGYINDPTTQPWRRQVERDSRVYYALKKEVDRVGDSAPKGKIAKWEEQAKQLLENTLHHSEVIHENDRWGEYEENHAGLFPEDWNWEDAKKRPGPGLDESVDPSDVTTKLGDVDSQAHLCAEDLSNDPVEIRRFRRWLSYD
ncbi:hypothetical protein BCR34DRAFT_607363 [Clohesyomyces aquaticus]|uniref:Uncharacterized protein n=1 Tax=Clohesyomyces aquaticus TaxID=1231657 RepID=A0A1Y1YGX6_9PLEO|nr:hypothetical protein BCR34DRAFT_607363 [Clohesyomyces aquaticus]